MPKALDTCTTSATKAGPLSDLIVSGILCHGMMSLRRAFVTSQAVSVRVGYASTQPEKVQMKTKRYLFPLLGPTSVKSTSKTSKGVWPQHWISADPLGPCQEFFWAQEMQLWETEVQSDDSWGFIKYWPNSGL